MGPREGVDTIELIEVTETEDSCTETDEKTEPGMDMDMDMDAG